MDTLQRVSFSTGGRPVLKQDIETGVYFSKIRGTWKIKQGDKHQAMVSGNGRYRGQKPVGESHDNWEASGTWMISGLSQDHCASNLSSFLAGLEDLAGVQAGEFLKWIPDGNTYPVFLERRGTAKWDPNYRWDEWQGGPVILVDVAFPIAPLARGFPMDITEDFGVKGSVQYTNLFINPSAEVNVTDGGWVGLNATLAQGSTAKFGSKSFQITALAANTNVSARNTNGKVPVTPGVAYSASAWFALGGGTAKSVRVYFDWYDVTNTRISVTPGASTPEGGIGAFVQAKAENFVAPANAVMVQIIAEAGANDSVIGDIHFIDGLILVQGTTVPSYFDGTFDGCDWSGTINNSTSRQYTDNALNDFTAAVHGPKSNLACANNTLTPAANLGTETTLIHTQRGYNCGDVECWLQGTPGGTVTNSKWSRVFNYVDANNFIEVYVDDNGTNSRLRVDVVLAGTRTNRATVNLASRIVGGSPFWVRGRIEGNVVYGEHFAGGSTAVTVSGHPDDLRDATTATPSYTLTAAEAAVLGSVAVGKTGFSWIPISPAATITYYRDWPFTYRSTISGADGLFPAYIPLAGPIPGDAPQLGSFRFEAVNLTGWPWMGLGWCPRPPAWNYCWFGDFDGGGTAGWSVAAVTNINGAATSITGQASGVRKFGSGAGEIICPATSGTGANFRLFRRFKKGVTYTLDIWVYSAAQVTQVIAKLGNAAANDVAVSTAQALSSTFSKITVQWTPTADRGDAHIGIVINAATATTFRIDGVEVYEGTTAPTLNSQIEGRGGAPPFGPIQAEACETSSLTNFAVGAVGSYRSGFGLTWAGIGAQATGTAQWLIDPSLLVADDFNGQEIQVEVWGRLDLASTLTQATAVLSVRPDDASITVDRYTAEFGSGGKSLLSGLGTSIKRLYRLGTLTMTVDRDRPKRQRLRLAITAAGSASTINIDELCLFVSKRRCLSPSGKAHDSSYPDFVPANVLCSKTIAPDLMGVLQSGSANPTGSAGLGGSLIEPPAGSLDVYVRPSNGVPDEPGTTTNDGAGELPAAFHFSAWPRWQLMDPATR